MTVTFPIFLDTTPHYASSSRYYKEMRARLVLGVIFNDNMVLTDSNAITSRNIRRLISEDDLFRELALSGYFKIAVRDSFSGRFSNGEFLQSAEQEFRSRGKIKWKVGDSDRRALEILDKNSPLVHWDYRSVSQFYTERCEALLESSSKIPEAILNHIKMAVSDYKSKRDGILERRMVYYDILNKNGKYYIEMNDSESKSVLEIFNGPYFCAIPHALGLSPIYAKRDAPAIRMVRHEKGYNFSPISDLYSYNTFFDAELMSSGLNLLDIEDIKRINGSLNMREFNSIRRNPSGSEWVRGFRELFHVIVVDIESCIIKKIPAIKSSSLKQRRMSIQTSIAMEANSKKKYLSYASGPLAPLAQFVLDIARPAINRKIDRGSEQKLERSGVSRAHMDAVAVSDFLFKKEEMNRYLRGIEGNANIDAIETVVPTDLFDGEIIA